jgi:two-component system NarL family response regulator
MNEIKILVVDDHEVVRRGLALVLGLESDFEVVGEAEDGAGAVKEVIRLQPDVVLLDLKMPGLDGRAAAELIKDQAPDTRVLMLSGAEIDDDVFDAIDADVDGYVHKDIGPSELGQAIRTVAEGKPFIDAAVTRELLKRLETTRSASAVANLTPRELDVLEQLATSATYRDIGERLFISEETVRSHVKGILAKLNQPNRTLAVVAGLKLGLIQLK